MFSAGSKNWRVVQKSGSFIFHRDKNIKTPWMFFFRWKYLRIQSVFSQTTDIESPIRYLNIRCCELTQKLVEIDQKRKIQKLLNFQLVYCNLDYANWQKLFTHTESMPWRLRKNGWGKNWLFRSTIFFIIRGTELLESTYSISWGNVAFIDDAAACTKCSDRILFNLFFLWEKANVYILCMEEKVWRIFGYAHVKVGLGRAINFMLAMLASPSTTNSLSA